MSISIQSSMLSKYYYKILIQYDGTSYCGFQWQKDIPTIQDDLNQAIGQVLSGKITTMGASRTDTGVHALHQIVKVTSENKIEDLKIFLLNLNKILPSQIQCLHIDSCEGLFRPANDSISKEYRYLFTNTLKSSCDDQKFIANNPYCLDISRMKLCTEKIVGVHDFKNFYSAGSNVKTTVRTIMRCDLTEVDPHIVFANSSIFSLPNEFRHCYQLRIEGNGFLKQMVRHLMSALWLVGSGKMTVCEFSLLLDGPKKTKRLWKVASPRGLYLYQLNYS